MLMIRSILSYGKKLILHPKREGKRLWFNLYNRRTPPHDIICQGNDFSLKLKSDSVLAEPLFLGDGFEESELRLLRNILQPGMKVFDIGANIGLYSIISGKAVGQNGHVWSFEPFPPIAEYLRQNVMMNNLSNVTVIQKAVSDTKGISDFHVFPDGSDVYNSLGAEERPVEKLHSVKKISVEVTTLDSFAKEAGIEKADILKIDVEGNEERVLTGAEQLIRNSPDVNIIMELYEPAAKQCGCSSERLITMLAGWGLGMYQISPSGKIIPTTYSTLSGVYALFRR